VDTGVGQDSIERRGELSGAVSDEEPELGDAVAEIHHQVADLLGSPSAIGVRGRTQHVHRPVGHLQHEEHVDPLEGNCQSTWKKSHASVVNAWARKNCRQVMSVSRTGAGGIRNLRRTRRIVDAPTRWPTLSNSPWILRYHSSGSPGPCAR
jgi:hypothetical protein